MGTIYINDDAFYALLDTVGDYLKSRFPTHAEPWITDKEAMRMLHIRSKTTLQSLRDQGLIRFSQPQKKIILYDRLSILEYIESHARVAYSQTRSK